MRFAIKYFFFIVNIAAILILTESRGQHLQLQRSSLGISGGTLSNESGNLIVSQTIGQSSLISTSANSELQISQGFIQPLIQSLISEESITSTIYPNPTDEVITLQLFGSLEYSVSVDLYNVEGILVKSWNVKEDKALLSLKPLDSGVYFAIVHNESKVFKIHKIIIK